MGDFVKAFEKFLSRDVTYIFGGAVVLWSFQHWRHGSVEVPSNYGPQLVLLAAVCYVVGFIVQEVATILHVVKTKASPTPNAFLQCLYRIYERRDQSWTPSASESDREKYEKAKQWLYDVGTDQRFRDDHERTESLKSLGTTLGPSFFVAGLLLWCSPSCTRARPCEVDNLMAGLVIGAGLIIGLLGWLKVMQQWEHLLARHAAYKK